MVLPVTFDLLDVVLAVLLTAAVTVAIMSPRLRIWAAGVAAVLAGVLLGRRVGTHQADDEDDEDDEPTPPTFDDEDHRENAENAADTDADPRADDAVDSVVDDILSGRRYDP